LRTRSNRSLSVVIVVGRCDRPGEQVTNRTRAPARYDPEGHLLE